MLRGAFSRLCSSIACKESVWRFHTSLRSDENLAGAYVLCFALNIIDIAAGFSSGFVGLVKVNSDFLDAPLQKRLDFIELSLLGIQLTRSGPRLAFGNREFQALLRYSRLGLAGERAVHSDGVESVVHLVTKHVGDIHAILTGRMIAVILASAALAVVVHTRSPGESTATSRSVGRFSVGSLGRGHTDSGDRAIVRGLLADVDGWRLVARLIVGGMTGNGCHVDGGM